MDFLLYFFLILFTQVILGILPFSFFFVCKEASSDEIRQPNATIYFACLLHQKKKKFATFSRDLLVFKQGVEAFFLSGARKLEQIRKGQSAPCTFPHQCFGGKEKGNGYKAVTVDKTF